MIELRRWTGLRSGAPALAVGSDITRDRAFELVLLGLDFFTWKGNVAHIFREDTRVRQAEPHELLECRVALQHLGVDVLEERT